MDGPAFERHDSEQNLKDAAELEERKKRNKKVLLEWITNADFTKEISLFSLSDHPVQLDNDEEEMGELSQTQILKIIKV